MDDILKIHYLVWHDTANINEENKASELGDFRERQWNNTGNSICLVTFLEQSYRMYVAYPKQILQVTEDLIVTAVITKKNWKTLENKLQAKCLQHTGFSFSTYKWKVFHNKPILSLSISQLLSDVRSYPLAPQLPWIQLLVLMQNTWKIATQAWVHIYYHQCAIASRDIHASLSVSKKRNQGLQYHAIFSLMLQGQANL